MSTDLLEEMFEAKAAFRARLDAAGKTPKERVDRLLLWADSIAAEAHELKAELPWKQWSSRYRILTPEAERAAAVEAVDVLHFLLNMFIDLGMDAAAVRDLYFEKDAVNHRRQDEGY